MKKILLAPDSFKGTLSAIQICDILTQQIRQVFDDVQVVSLPAADGGEGTADCLRAARGGQIKQVQTTGPFSEPITACYTLLEDGTAVVELAAAAGFAQAAHRKDPAAATTYGVGALLRAAAADPQRKGQPILVGLGGSCTNDFGCGLAAACGVKFLDINGKTFVPTGATLSRIAQIDISELDPHLAQAPLIAMTDVTSPLFGPDGAAFVFAPQKGADEAMVQQLDEGLRHVSQIVQRDLGQSVAQLPGAGAAGGAGGGLAAMLDARLQSGIATVLQALQFEQQLTDADLVITGEGRMDRQSVSGKVLSGVAAAAVRAKVPVIAIVGGYDGLQIAEQLGLTAVFSINTLPQPLQISAPHAAQNLAATASNIFRLIRARL